MRRAGVTAGVILGAFVAFIAAVFAVSELGAEVVTLRTVDASGGVHETHLWIVDHDGSAWLRSGQPGSGWLARIDANPKIEVVRGSETLLLLAQPVRNDARLRDEIHDRIAEKYGWAESFIAVTRDGSLSVPVRLRAESG